MSAQGGYSNKYGNTRSFGPCFENHYSAQGHKTLDQTTLDTAILNSVKICFNIWNPLYKKYAFIVPLFLLPNSELLAETVSNLEKYQKVYGYERLTRLYSNLAAVD